MQRWRRWRRRIASGQVLNLQLREVIESDLETFFVHQADLVSMRLAFHDRAPRTRAEFDAHWNKILRDPEGLIRTIVHENKIAGNILSFTLESHRYVGYWLGQEFWGKGIATEALRQFLVLEPIRPLYAITTKHNLGSIKVLQRAGFSLIEEAELELRHRLG